MDDLVQRLRARHDIGLHRILTEAADEIERLRSHGPQVQRGTNDDGTPWIGTMRDALEDAIQAAAVEARLADGLRAQLAERDMDAERYRWLRLRIKVREERSLAGTYRDSIYTRVGQSFFDTPTRGAKGYTDPTKFEAECASLDAAIDAAMAPKP